MMFNRIWVGYKNREKETCVDVGQWEQISVIMENIFQITFVLDDA